MQVPLRFSDIVCEVHCGFRGEECIYDHVLNRPSLNGGEKGTGMNQLQYFTCLMGINQLMETIARVTQLKEHICIFDVIADLVLNDPGTIYES